MVHATHGVVCETQDVAAKLGAGEGETPWAPWILDLGQSANYLTLPMSGNGVSDLLPVLILTGTPELNGRKLSRHTCLPFPLSLISKGHLEEVGRKEGRK